MQVDYFSMLLVFAGTLMYWFTSWGESYLKDGKEGLWTFTKREPPRWAVATVGSIVAYLTLPQLGPYIGIEPPLGAVAAGYVASSLGSKFNLK